MKSASLAFVLCSALSSTPAAAGPTVFGQYDCGRWVNTKSDLARAWLLGYLSGINYAITAGKFDPLDRVNSADQIFLWMDNYCRTNPLNSVTKGANALYEELEQKTKLELQLK